MARWTRTDTYKFFIIAAIPVFLFEILGFKWLHVPWLPIALIGTAVAFLVSFKNNASYGRLWEARQIWGGIVNSSRSFGIMINDFITNEHSTEKKTDDELRDIKRIISHRHIAWMTAHRYNLRQKKPWESFRDSKTNREFSDYYEVQEWKIPFEEAVAPHLSKEEMGHISGKTNKAAQILSLQSNHLRRLKEEGLIWEFAFLEMENLIKEMFTFQGKNERIKNFPYPRQFATLNMVFVWIFIILIPFGMMSEFDKIGVSLVQNIQDQSGTWLDKTYEFIASNFVWLTVPFSMIISWVFYTMERIGEVSENPFEGTANDVPISTMARGIEIDMREMLGESPETIPDPLPMKYNIQT
jgi:putative membrane protein